jgi:hypothetical protein
MRRGVSLPKSPTKLSAVIQFVVLKREDKWVVKANDQERLFGSTGSGERRHPTCERQWKGRKGRRGAPAKIESRIPKDLDIWRESLSSGEIGFAWDVMEAETARGDPDLATRD